LNFIEGPNNAGKTTAFFAVEYALFGRVEGFKTIRSLMQPGKRSIGVELLFTGKTGERFLLQRIHQSPPKSKKTLEGHFTLKQILDDGESYILASDFGDTEDKLALKLQELTGLTRRFFCIALHMRQGEIPAILDGSKQLDIVLGVTAAAMAEDELRQLALELEKESAGLPVLRERIRAIGAELEQVSREAKTLAEERNSTGAKLAALGEAADPRQELDARLSPLVKAVAGVDEHSKGIELAARRRDDERERLDEQLKNGTKDAVEKELTDLAAKTKSRDAALAKSRKELDAATAEEKQLHTRRGDLAGRIERRQGLPKGKGAKCEVCGAAIDAAQMKKELAAWTAELEKLDEQLAASKTKLDSLKASIAESETAERAGAERAAKLKEHRDAVAALEKKIAQRQAEVEAAESGAATALTRVRDSLPELKKTLAEFGVAASTGLDGETTAMLAAIRDSVQTLKQAVAEKAGRQIAERQALTDLLLRFDTQSQSLAKRQSDLEREQATALADAGLQEVKAKRAERFRRISAAFKEFQVKVREEATAKLAAETLAIQRKLAPSDEFDSLTIDPAHYDVQVVPKALGEAVPASLYEGGGHRLLLGLSYRLAIARLVEQCPVLLLDEPTYGLDQVHREHLLDRLGDKELAKQILLVSHHAKPGQTGNRVKLARKEQETVVE
jgi:DNA repair exonuclease SbcCD ATPase subunit